MTTPQTPSILTPKLARKRSLRGAAHTAIGDIMSREVVTVPLGLDLDSLATLLIERSLSRVPVVDAQGRVVGIVSKTDLVEDRQRDAHSSTAEDIMVESVLSLSESATITEASRVMAANNIHGAPVVSPAGDLVGYLSALDILAWLSGQR